MIVLISGARSLLTVFDPKSKKDDWIIKFFYVPSFFLLRICLCFIVVDSYVTLRTFQRVIVFFYHGRNFLPKDIETFDLEDFKYNNVNITAFRLVDIQNPSVADVVEQMKKFQPNGQANSDVGLQILQVQYSEEAILMKTKTFSIIFMMFSSLFSKKNPNKHQTEPALMYDSVALFAAGLQSLDRSHKLKPVNLSCEQETPWEDGTSLYNYLNSVNCFVHAVLSFFNLFLNWISWIKQIYWHMCLCVMG